MYQAGIYCRISIEEQKKAGEYSNSIHSQIQMAKDYIADHSDVVEVKIYADDGASGSNFERAEFRRMLADIELGIINMVILKDVSRLGREHIDTNYYLGKYFPEKRVRVVSILDHYDSSVATHNELLEIKTLLNDMYLRDTSKKIKTIIQTKRSMGEYTPKEPPFGYVKSKTIRNHLEVDAYAAKVVNQNVSRDIDITTFIITVNTLTAIQNFTHILLRKVTIFTQIPYSLIHAFHL